MKMISDTGRHGRRTPIAVTLRRVTDALYGVSLLGICFVIFAAQAMIETRGGAAILALILLASGGIGQLARWLEGEVRRHVR